MTPKLILILLAALALAGCGGSSDDRLIGKFEGSAEMDLDQMMGQNGMAEGMDKVMVAQFKARMKERAEKMANQKLVVEFKADGTWQSAMGESGMGQGPMGLAGEGTWEIIEKDGSTLKVSMESDFNPGRHVTMVFDAEGGFTSDDFVQGGMFKIGSFSKVAAQ